jgi:predicted lactoylglutathione lyase
MAQMIFVNLPVADLARARAFYEAVGFVNDSRFTDETAACMVLSEAISVMLLTREKFAGFTALPVAEEKAATAHILAVSREDRAGVDAFATAALANGGAELREKQDYGFMHLRAITDPDGHMWEPMWMDLDAALKAMGRA